ncbi:hypothetical protein V6N12_028603 [Hibiscus sabdariffa]|uniref:Uncharacterized protein n=1 Tax=Hibiscus sabdariffa TaxID=183260 RepID=A0ABR2F6B7_9ROSI
MKLNAREGLGSDRTGEDGVRWLMLDGEDDGGSRMVMQWDLGWEPPPHLEMEPWEPFIAAFFVPIRTQEKRKTKVKAMANTGGRGLLPSFPFHLQGEEPRI